MLTVDREVKMEIPVNFMRRKLRSQLGTQRPGFDGFLRVMKGRVLPSLAIVRRPGAVSLPRLLALLLTACAVFAPYVSKGQKEGGEELSSHEVVPTFTVQAERNLVLVRVVVRDAKGAPIDNLRKEDFRLFDGGKLQTILNFSVEKPTLKPAEKPSEAKNPLAELGAAEESGISPSAAGRFLALYFDDVHTPFEDLARTRDAADHYLAASLQAGDRVGVFTTSGQNQVDFAGELAKVHQALSELRPQPTAPQAKTCANLSPYQAYLIYEERDQTALDVATKEVLNNCVLEMRGPPGGQAAQAAWERARQQAEAEATAAGTQVEMDSRAALRGIEALARRMTSLPGQRSVVIVSGGFLTERLQKELGEIIDRALRANVIINALDARGLYTDPAIGDASKHAGVGGEIGSADNWHALKGQILSQSARLEIAGMQSLAFETGGIFFANSNDLEAGFRRTAALPGAYYVLAFSPQNLKLDGAFHPLQVRLVSQHGLTLQARRGYFAAEKSDDPSAREKEEIEEAVFSQDEMQGIPIEVHTQFFQGNGSETRLSVLIHLNLRVLHFHKQDGRNLNRLVFVTALFDRDGRYVAGKERDLDLNLRDSSLEKLEQSGIHLKTNFDLKPGVYLVRQIVRDREGGQVSGVTQSVEIPFLPYDFDAGGVPATAKTTTPAARESPSPTPTGPQPAQHPLRVGSHAGPAAPVAGSTRVAGKVTDVEGDPVPGATAWLATLSAPVKLLAEASSDAAGSFALELPHHAAGAHAYPLILGASRADCLDALEVMGAGDLADSTPLTLLLRRSADKSFEDPNLGVVDAWLLSRLPETAHCRRNPAAACAELKSACARYRKSPGDYRTMGLLIEMARADPNPGAQMLAALELIRMGSLQRAERTLTRLLQKPDAPAEAFLLRGVLWNLMRRPEEATRDLTQALRSQPDDTLIQLELGRAAIHAADWTAARKWLAGPLEDRGLSPYAHYLNARALLAEGDVKSAATDTELLVRQVGQENLPAAAQNLIAQIEQHQRAESRPHFDSVLNEPVAELKTKLSELGDLDANAPPPLGGLEEILAAVGTNIQNFFRDFSSTAATEVIQQTQLDDKGRPRASRSEEFYYVFLQKEAEGGHMALEEYRSPVHGLPTASDGVESGYMRTSGFASSLIVFDPRFQPGVRYRFLGRQTVEGHPAYVVGFAQQPSNSPPLGSFRFGPSHSRVLTFGLQGVAWISIDQHQVLKLRTDMLHPLPEVQLARATSEVDYAPLQFAGSPNQLWLPSRVTVNVEWGRKRLRNQHVFSQFRLFKVETESKVAGPPREAAKPSERVPTNR
jgi:VWFA-related protein